MLVWTMWSYWRKTHSLLAMVGRGEELREDAAEVGGGRAPAARPARPRSGAGSATGPPVGGAEVDDGPDRDVDHDLAVEADLHPAAVDDPADLDRVEVPFGEDRPDLVRPCPGRATMSIRSWDSERRIS